MRPTAVLLLLAAAARAGDVEERVATIVASLTRQEKLELLNGIGWDQWDIRDGYYVGDGAQIARHRRDVALVLSPLDSRTGRKSAGRPREGPPRVQDARRGPGVSDPRS